jgi:hypothetical protein
MGDEIKALRIFYIYEPRYCIKHFNRNKRQRVVHWLLFTPAQQKPYYMDINSVEVIREPFKHSDHHGIIPNYTYKAMSL